MRHWVLHRFTNTMFDNKCLEFLNPRPESAYLNTFLSAFEHNLEFYFNKGVPFFETSYGRM